MRFSDRITLIYKQDGGYNPDSSGYDEEVIEETTLPCKLSRLGIQRTNELFGTIDTHIVVARLQSPYNKQITSAKVDSGMFKGEYAIKRQSDYRKGVIFLEGAFE